MEAKTCIVTTIKPYFEEPIGMRGCMGIEQLPSVVITPFGVASVANFVL